FHFSADATALCIWLALFRALDCRDAQYVSIIQFRFEGKPFVAKILCGATLGIFGFARHFAGKQCACQIQMTEECGVWLEIVPKRVKDLFCAVITRRKILRVTFA